jgi:hypothetical protein
MESCARDDVNAESEVDLYIILIVLKILLGYNIQEFQLLFIIYQILGEGNERTDSCYR